MIDPYRFVRGITIALGTFWFLRGAWRSVRFLVEWGGRLEVYGFPRPWLARQVATVLARATILDPINLALLCTLVLLWKLRQVVA